jgi:predicted TPR repeat methyltransferase
MSKAQSLLRQAWELRRAGQLEEAEKKALAASRIAPPLPQALHFLGVVRVELGKFAEAEWALGQALKLAPALDAVWCDLGVAHHRQGHFSRAGECYQKAMALDPAQGIYPGYLGSLLLDLNRLEEAKDFLDQALRLLPVHAPNWFNLGRVLELQGDGKGALHAYRRCLAADTNDSCGASIKLAQLGEGPLPGRMAPEGVRAFYAARAAAWHKDKAIGAGYGGLALFERALAAVAQAGEGLSILDAGCGTGLAGGLLRPCAARLTGLDLSPDMLRQARASGHYDRLIEGDLLEFLAGGETFDLIAAAAVLLHFGDLAPVLARMKGALGPGGRIAFTVLTHEGADVRLDSASFFRHGLAHVKAALAAAGFAALGIEEGVHELHDGQPVMGLAVGAALT